MNIFDVIGPVMVGPSSSHTAGAVRIGAIAREILGVQPSRAVIRFYGSFAKTYKGHGTDMAVIGGLLGMPPDSPDIKNSFQTAVSSGLSFQFEISDEKCEHPNAVLIEARGSAAEAVSILAFSVGGGNVLIRKLNGTDVEFTGQFHTLIVPHSDQPGTIAAVTGIFAKRGINIAFMKVYRSKCRGESIMIIETDQRMDKELVEEVKKIPSVTEAKVVEALP